MSSWTENNKKHFNAAASDYDKYNHAHELTTKGAKAIIDEYKIANHNHQEARAFELGIGTGLVAVKLAPFVKSILGVDISEVMLQEVQKKLDDPINAPIASKIKTVQHLVKDDDPLPALFRDDVVSAGGEGFDLVYANMVMHHIEDPLAMINMMAKHFVKKGSGWFYVVDIQHVAGLSDKWHKKATNGAHHHHHHHHHPHHPHGHSHAHGHGEGRKHETTNMMPRDPGFKDEDLKRWFSDAGLVDVVVKTGFIIEFYIPSEEKALPFQFVIAGGRRP